ncbi:MAG: hypothetical protein HDR88_18045 [Bacteroides sp.]|nr:hypothetical protein [Bacteroides sp.]
MNQAIKELENDPDGMTTYDYIVNNVDSCIADMPELIENLKRVDVSGQFLASTARFLHAVDCDSFSECIPSLIEGAIFKDRERRYIGALLEAVWGADYKDNAVALMANDDNFRRIYKRIYPEEAGINTGGL